MIDFGERVWRGDYQSLVDWYAADGAEHENTGPRERAFAGGSRATALRVMRDGDDETRRMAEEAVRALESLDFETDGRTFEAGPVGFAPNVPAVLAGTPDPMWEMVPDPDSGAPCQMRINIQAVASTTAPEIRTRMVAAIALAQVLARFRPVTVTLVSYCDIGGGRRNKIEVDLGCAPLDLGRVSSVCHPTFYRRVVMAKRCALNGLKGATARGTAGTLIPDERAHPRQDGDLVLPRALPSHFRAIERDPAGWVRAQATAYLAGDPNAGTVDPQYDKHQRSGAL